MYRAIFLAITFVAVTAILVWRDVDLHSWSGIAFMFSLYGLNLLGYIEGIFRKPLEDR